jgi:predicted RNase H-like nuclease (RuvC/YqgF family)
MKDQRDNQTVEIFPAPRRRGRPVTGQAKTAAERMRAYRERKRVGQVQSRKTVTVSSVTENSEIERLRAEVETLEKRNLELQMRVDVEHVKALKTEALEWEIGRLKSELRDQRKANGVLKGQVTAVKNRTALQVKVLRELVSWYTYSDETGRVEGSHVPYVGDGIPRTNRDICEKWEFAADLLKS